MSAAEASWPLAAVDDHPDLDDQFRTLIEDDQDKPGVGSEPAEPPYEVKVQLRLERLRVERDAKHQLEAEGQPPLRTLRFSEFLAEKGAEPYVHGFFYVDSNHRLYGPPGGGKSLLLLDIGLRAALGWEWSGVPIVGGPVIFVMAEGQRVNHDRTLAWLDYYGVSDDDRRRLEDRFITVPDAVMLTEGAAKPFVEYVRQVQPSLIILDTKNRMMIGEENSATDWGVLLRVLDALRMAAGGAAVVLVDHTGHDADRPRGSTAGTGGMETEIRVREEKSGNIQAVVTRDKSGGDGFIRDFRIRVHESPELPTRTRSQPVLVPALPVGPDDVVDLDELVDGEPEPGGWIDAEADLPQVITDYDKAGAAAVTDLARYMAVEAFIDRNDPGVVGKERREAQRALVDAKGYGASTVHRAWSYLISIGKISRAPRVHTPTGRHIWTPDGEPLEHAEQGAAEPPTTPITGPSVKSPDRSRGRSTKGAPGKRDRSGEKP